MLMKNEYVIVPHSKTVLIIAKGRNENHEVAIDYEDLEKVSDVGTWVVAYDKGDKIGRVVAGNPSVALHKLVLGYYGEKVVDHINRNPLDNRKKNLRVVTVSENGQNRGLNKNSTTGVRGLTWCKISNKYRARTQIEGKRISIGLFETLEDGKEAIKDYRLKHTVSID